MHTGCTLSVCKKEVCMELKNTHRIQCRWTTTLSYMVRFLLLLAFAGCAQALHNTAWFVEDNELDATFNAGQVLPDYQYYYSGPDAEPLAILGVRRDYQFEKGLWKEIDLTESQMQKWLERIQNPYRSLRYRYDGSYIVDKEGNRVAIWFSILDRVTAMIDAEKKKITVHTPDNTIIPAIPFTGVGGGGS